MKKIYSFFVFVLVFVLSSCTPKDRWAQIMESYLPNDSVAQLLLVKHTEGSNAIAEFYLKENGTWQLVGKNPVFIGENGLGKEKEGDRKTPVGEFSAYTAFGILPDPGTACLRLSADFHLRR